MKAKIKNRYWLNVLTLLISAVFVLSLFPGIATADTPRDNYQDAKENYKDAKENYKDAKENYKDAKENYKDAKENYKDAKIKYNEAKLKYKSAKNNLSRDELIDKTRDYLENAADYMISHLELLKDNVESSENKGVLPTGAAANIDAHIVQITDIKTKIQAANTTEELIDSARELEDAWIKIDLEARYYAGIIANHRIDLFIAKASNASERMDILVQKLKDQGKDTSKLEEEASGFNNLMNEAKQNHQNDLTLFASHNGFDSSGKVTSIQDAKAFLQQATSSQKDTLRKLKSATEQSRDFFKEARKLIDRKIVVARGTGKLEANGTGKALIKGNVTVTLSGNATLIVSSNADVTTDGAGTKEIRGNGDIKYQGFGSATITGENIRIEISGNEITLTAEGTGSAILTGKGTYRIEKEFTASGDWKKEV